MKTLVIVGHPNLTVSRYSRAVVEEIRKQNNPDITLHVLSEKYSDFRFDVKHEQDLLILHERIVFVFPVAWYDVPFSLKKWEEDILLSGFAYGEGGDKLKGKSVFFAVTSAGNVTDYSAEGYNNYPIMRYLEGVAQTFRLCEMDVREPILFQGVYKRPEEGIKQFAKAAYEYIIKADAPAWPLPPRAILV